MAFAQVLVLQQLEIRFIFALFTICVDPYYSFSWPLYQTSRIQNKVILFSTRLMFVGELALIFFCLVG